MSYAPAVPGSSGGGDFKPHPAGGYVAALNRIILLGHQKTTWNNEEKWTQKVNLGFLTSAIMEDGERAGEPWSMSSTYTYSMGKNANLRGLIEGWFAAAFQNEETAGSFDLTKLLHEKYCNVYLNIAHKDDTAGRTWANITSAGKFMSADMKPVSQGEVTYFNIHAWDQGAYDNLSEYWKNKVNASQEVGSGLIDPSTGEPIERDNRSDDQAMFGDDEVPPKQVQGDEDFDDDIPF